MGRATGRGVKTIHDPVKGDTVFDGDWDDSKLIKGKCQYPDGLIYDGQWIDGKPEGRGVKSWPDGRIYEGYWY